MRETAFILEGTNFFICLVAGVLLALGFQLLLTALSVAGGITAVGNIRKQGHSHPAVPPVMTAMMTA